MFLAFPVCGCGLDEFGVMPGDTAEIEFTSSKVRIITKSGDLAQRFEPGTAFSLYAVQNDSGVSEWNTDAIKFYDVPGVSDESGNVDYSIDDGGRKATYGLGEVLDFYGLTYGDSVKVDISGMKDMVPVVPVSVADGILPDLMYSDNLKAKNSSSGVLNMEFRHVMSRLEFEILKQDETGVDESEKKLENAVLKKVILRGTGTSGRFNAANGEWENIEVQDRVIYDSSLPLTVSAQRFASLIAVPADGDVSLRIYIEGIVGGVEYVDYTLNISEDSNLRLEQNHEYLFSVTVLKNDVRIVAVTPKIYDWIDVGLNDDVYFGQPVYFGGLMWMDRNLGAKTADCENSWYNTIGFYYQHGRNIPYVMDTDVWKEHFKSLTGNNRLYFDGSASPEPFQFPYGLLYSLDENDNKITDVLDLQYTFKTYEEIAINPGDVGKDYRFILGLSPSLAIASHSWAVQKTDQVSSRYYYVNNDATTTRYYYKEDTRNDTYWSENVENQPCPKGWRLPTRKDLYSFMPEYTGNMTWQASYTRGTPLTGGTKYCYVSSSGNPYDPTYTWKYYAGKFDVDETAGPETYYSDPVPSSLGRVFGIKYEGTDKAYRLLIEQKRAKVEDDDSERLFVRVSRFNATKDDCFEVNGSQWNLHRFDWSCPVEYMDFPLCGFLDSYGFIDDFGDGCIMRIADHDTEGRNWTIYFRNEYKGVSVGSSSCRTLGDQIRCVRDINAK